jgi:hypothetical protein
LLCGPAVKMTKLRGCPFFLNIALPTRRYRFDFSPFDFVFGYWNLFLNWACKLGARRFGLNNLMYLT